jgi:hypothetical protein
LQVV